LDITDADRTKIENAVKTAEAKTSGEIVPLVVQRSANYDSLRLRGALFGLSIGGLLGCLFTVAQIPGPDSFEVLTLSLKTLSLLIVPTLIGGFIGGALLDRSVGFLRLIMPEDVIDDAIRTRAQRAFLEHELFNTRDRTGILIMVSLDERRVTVLSDTGINSVVPETTWDACVTLVLDGIKRGDFGAGMAEAIERCGQIVTDAGFEIRDDDTNELSNTLQVEA